MDSSAAFRSLENTLAVLQSGVWTIDGEYKGPSGVYYKLTGYFAHVSSTSVSADDGDAALLGMYLEPMAGGSPQWLSVLLSCWTPKGTTIVRCLPTNGASSLLDLNFESDNLFSRGDPATVVITEPDSKEAGNRFFGRSTNRGKIVLARPK